MSWPRTWEQLLFRFIVGFLGELLLSWASSPALPLHLELPSQEYPHPKILGRGPTMMMERGHLERGILDPASPSLSSNVLTECKVFLSPSIHPSHPFHSHTVWGGQEASFRASSSCPETGSAVASFNTAMRQSPCLPLPNTSFLVVMPTSALGESRGTHSGLFPLPVLVSTSGSHFSCGAPTLLVAVFCDGVPIPNGKTTGSALRPCG